MSFFVCFDELFDFTDFLAVVEVVDLAAADFVSSDQLSSFQPQSSLGFLKKKKIIENNSKFNIFQLWTKIDAQSS